MQRKVVVMCGSIRHMDVIQKTAERLELEKGYVVITMLPHVLPQELTEDERKLLGELHLKKIDLADAVYVVNVNGYMGEAVKREIAYAAAKGKEILYLEEKKCGI